MADELSTVESFLTGLLLRLEPAGRVAAMRDIARTLRRSQQQRIAGQRNPDGSAYDPRKARAKPDGKQRDKRGRIKREAMFVKMRTGRYLKVESDASGLAIGFDGRVARLARVHQYGERSRVAPGGPEYKYPVRMFLGLTADEREMIRDMLLKHITK
ncbi:phage virion morphogenesis protein [Burkholderia multivorans]|uniref:phage virion morphogenesis protein n=1 Tax=Burkholderia multivorans TaxID=87883 RepID=UPI000CFF0EC6|nr:phage virion morphogenesis protein [Burkholderia multivorans]PRF67562.1 phage virion morphogenesis protein [Burkholderia multivorans]